MTGIKWSRTAVFLVFVVFGLCISTWAVHIPSVQQRIGVSAGTLGTLLLLHGAGALIGMQVSGPLISRWGSARISLIGAAAMCTTVTFPLVAPSAPLVAGGLLLFGSACGVTDVAMNARAVTVEQEVGRPIMSAFHAVFSVGSVIGSLIGAAMLATNWTMWATAAAIGCGCLLLTAITAPNLLSVPAEAMTENKTTDEAGPVDRRRKRRHLVLLGALAFLLLLAEGCAMDWSSLHAQTHLGVPKALGALVFGAFVTAMTVGRFTADWVSARKGPVWVVRWGGLLSAIGLGIVVASPLLPVTMFGWLVVGLGLSGGLPQVFSAAGNVRGASGTEFSRVVGAGYVALLAGPAIIGWLSELITLNLALLLPMAAACLAALGAGAVRGEDVDTAAPLRA
ncbi:putative major facilitator superfamily protein [Mycolicibacterium madagascariense]|uniref:Putative major facilitator superfamily protein n=1 Tax=Mycolicibacterium madagascariense TaxID=212765 RepID=A0A7I7XBC1_9MYCO|nr:MFS transporter [Mycolicibacterium madagascariense]MCV7013500.1 MFS transporter [Mycolicibacterium madagascariense]BBZ26946.1 putative major facilitator superfamily protein [Mycolicibacterium madagascariense]